MSGFQLQLSSPSQLCKCDCVLRAEGIAQLIAYACDLSTRRQEGHEFKGILSLYELKTNETLPQKQNTKTNKYSGLLAREKIQIQSTLNRHTLVSKAKLNHLYL